jgi:hypothetical protein
MTCAPEAAHLGAGGRGAADRPSTLRRASLPPSRIRGASRTRYDEAEIVRLGGSLRRRGMLHPIRVREVEDGFQKEIACLCPADFARRRPCRLYQSTEIVRRFDHQNPTEPMPTMNFTGKYCLMSDQQIKDVLSRPQGFEGAFGRFHATSREVCDGS